MAEPDSAALVAQHGSPYSGGEKCRMCANGREAQHKVGEEDARPGCHNYTAYLCCWCFGLVMGKTAERECDRYAKQRAASEVPTSTRERKT